MLKLQSYLVLKFKSARLKRSKYKVNLTIDEARSNGEIVRLGDCQLLNSIRSIVNRKEYSPVLEKRLRHLRKGKGYDERIKKLRSQIDESLFVPEIVYIEFDDARHYPKLIESGLFINGKKYVRLLSSAGNARKKTTMFCQEEIYEKLDYILDCGRDPEYKINPSKFNAYYSLSSSGGHSIDIPRIVVIPDCEVKRITPVDFVSENKNPLEDPIVEYKEVECTFNLFDGQGLMSRTFSNIIADRLELDYTPSAVIFRGAFQKGMLVTFDFKEFSKVYGVQQIKDIYGKVFDVGDVDVILSASQFKLSGAYQSTQQYLDECKKRNFKWTITRPTPEKDNNVTTSNYQYLQVLNLNDDDIEKLAQPTIQYLQNVSGLDWMSSVLFLMGGIEEKNLSKEWFDRLDPIVKQLLYKPEIISDKYIQNKLRRMLGKKVNEACEGKLLLDGNYSVMISDPFAQAQWAFGLQPIGLLGNREFYSAYWNEQKIDEIAAMRSPLTWESEVNILNLKKSKKMIDWYHYSTSGIIYNIYDNSTLIHAGNDFDFDIVATTSNQQIINGAMGGIPVLYEKKTAGKQRIEKSELWKADIRTFDNKIGFLTNLATTMFSIRARYKPEDEEYKILTNRLKTCCALQSMVIDYGKGIEVMPIPRHWATWNKWDDETASEEEIELKKSHNKILAEQRPYFMIYTYPQKEKRYREHFQIYDAYSRCHFKMGIKELVSVGANGSEEKQKCIDFYFRYSPIIDTPSVMNKISHFVEGKVKPNRKISDFGWQFDVDGKKIERMNELYHSWKNERDIESEYSYSHIGATYRKLADDISINSKEIAKLALMTNRRFANSVFSEDILNLFKTIKMNIPVLCKDGDREFYGNKYKIIEFLLED